MTQRRKRVYIAGPMTGVADHNFPAFHDAAQRFRAAGWEVANPAENFGGQTDLPRATYLRADLTILVDCDAIALLPGWRESRGARLEYLVARELGLELLDAETGEPLADVPEAFAVLVPTQPTPVSILDEAKRITSGSRQADYGHPREDFARTAAMWNGILAGKLREGQSVRAMDIPLCLIAVKLARQAHRHKRDNLVDIAGYARTAAMVAGEE